MFFEGANDAVSGLTVGERYYLSTAGGVETSPTTVSGELLQLVGWAVSATAINTDIQDCITRA